MTGVDLSNYQASLSMGDLKKNGLSFAILKATESITLSDRSFARHHDEGMELGIPMGAYCFSHATNVEQARSEAAFILHVVDGRELPLGIYMDVELDSQMAISNSQLQEVIHAFCQVIRNGGYRPGLYGSEYRTWHKIDQNKLPEDVIKWVAHYGKAPAFDCDLWQSTDQHRIIGYNGNLDYDHVLSKRFEDLVNSWSIGDENQMEPQQNELLKPGILFPRNPTVIAMQLWLNHDLNQYGIDTPIDGQKTTRFFEDFNDFIWNHSDKMSKDTVLAYQLWLNYNGYNVPEDGKKTKQFLNTLREFSKDMKSC